MLNGDLVLILELDMNLVYYVRPGGTFLKPPGQYVKDPLFLRLLEQHAEYKPQF